MESPWIRLSGRRALEYEINQDLAVSGLPLTELDDLYPLQDSASLGAALAQLNTPTILEGGQAVAAAHRYRLSQPGSRFGITLTRTWAESSLARKQFNAFVRDPANRVDLDGNGSKEACALPSRLHLPGATSSSRPRCTTTRPITSTCGCGAAILPGPGAKLGRHYPRPGRHLLHPRRRCLPERGADDIRVYKPARASANIRPHLQQPLPAEQLRAGQPQRGLYQLDPDHQHHKGKTST